MEMEGKESVTAQNAGEAEIGTTEIGRAHV